MDMKQIEAVRNKILSDYKNTRYIDKTDIFSLPEKQEVISVTEKLVRLLFPGYYRNGDYRFYNIDTAFSQLIEDIAYRLSKQIRIVLISGSGEEEFEKGKEKAESICLEFLNKVPEIRAVLDTDLDAIYEGDPAAYSKDEIVFSYPGMYAIAVFRLAHELWELEVPIIPRIMTEHAHSLTGVDIHPGATIGKYFMIDHGTGIVVGETTVIGDHVKLYQGVTLGGLSTREGQRMKSTKRHPTIGNRVTIYAGASILGGETLIGDGVVIGSNVFITKSVKANTRVSIKDQDLLYNPITASAGDENFA